MNTTFQKIWEMIKRPNLRAHKVEGELRYKLKA
jgi:hypothetical protein